MTKDRSRAVYGHVVNNFKILNTRHENLGLSSSISCPILKVLVGNRLSFLGYRTLHFASSRPVSGYDLKLSLDSFLPVPVQSVPADFSLTVCSCVVIQSD